VIGPFALPLGQGLGMVYRLAASLVVLEREVKRPAPLPDAA